jgi:hypothetical protein
VTAPLPRLPKLLAVALKAGGLDVVMKLSKQFGGQQLKLPPRCGDSHPLVVAAGRKVADAICAEAGGIGKFDFPKGAASLQRLALDELLTREPPATLNEIAASLGITHRRAAQLKDQLEAGQAPAAPRSRRKVDPRQIDIEDMLHKGE